MRNYQTLDDCRIDPETDNLELFFAGAKPEYARLAMRREGAYVSISASYGPLEIALRPRYDDLARTLSRLAAVEGLHTTRQVGTAQAYLAMGLTSDGSLLLRPTIVADATGHLSFNLQLTPKVRTALYEWLKVPNSVVAH